MKLKFSRVQKSVAAGGVVMAIVAATLIYGYWKEGASALSPGWIPLVAVMSGALFSLLIFRQLRVWASFAGLGMAIGIMSAGQMFVGPLFEEEFYVGLLTYAVFAGLGLLLGCTAQFIVLLHQALHRAFQALSGGREAPVIKPKS
jgi:hypothetical protein